MSTNLGWIGPLTDMLFGAGEAYENNRRADMYQKLGKQALAAQGPLSEEMRGWGRDDWEHFKSVYAPAEETITGRAREGITAQTDRVTGAANVDVRRAAGGGYGIMRRGLTARGIDPGSGAGIAAMTSMGNREAGAYGIGVNRARTGERERVDDFNWNNRMGVVRAGRGIPVSAALQFSKGQDLLNVTSRRALGLSDNYSSAGASGLYDVGRGAGNLTSQYVAYDRSNRDKASGSWDFNNTDQYGNTYADNTTDDYFDNQEALFKADGGLIVGPGTGRSDSIPASVDGQMPARVSNGEYHIPAAVVAVVGKDKLDAIKAKFHRGMNHG